MRGCIQNLTSRGPPSHPIGLQWASSARQEVRGYQAGVSYTDNNVGVVLDELKALGHWNNTVIIFWGDHGWKLGQHGAWAKHTNFHCDTNTPVMLRVPGLTDGGEEL